MAESAPEAKPGRRRDLLCGIACLAAGLGVALQARSYGSGTLAAAGPGLYPLMLGGLLALVGALMALTAMAAGPDADEPEMITEGDFGLSGPGLSGPDWRGWCCIIGGVLLFILFAWMSGLAPAIFACVFVAALGDRSATLKGSLALALTMSVFGTILFGKLLGINMPLWQLPFAS